MAKPASSNTPDPSPAQPQPGPDTLDAAMQRLEFHTENSPLGVIEWSPDWRFVRWSNQAEQIFGWPADEILNTPWDAIRFVYEPDLPDVIQTIEQLTDGRQTTNITRNRNYTRSGQVVYCEWYNSAMRGPDGELLGILSLVHDVTDRETVAQQLRDRELELREANRIARIGSWVYDLRTHRVTWSPEARDLLQCETGDLTTRLDDFVACYPPEDQTRLRQCLRDAIQNARRVELDLTTDSMERPARHSVVLSPIQDDAGEVVLVRSTIQDITARVQMETQRAESEARFRLIAEYSNDIVALHDTEGRYLYVSPAIERVLGLSAHDAVGTDPYALIHPEDAEQLVRPKHAELADGQQVAPVQFRMRHTDGHYVWLETHSGVVHDEAGRITHIVTSARDVTDRIRAQSEARARELAHLARLATIGEMSTSIAHEVNQPLAAIAMLARAYQPALERGEADPKAILEVLSQVREETLRAGQIIHRVKTIAKRKDSTREDADLVEIVQQSIASADPSARHHGCAIRFDPPDHPAPIRADPLEITQVLLNLLINAIDAMSDTPPERNTARLWIEDTPDQWVVHVLDQGPGVPESMRHDIFGAFISTKDQGLGLGLSISFNIMENHDGRLWVENADPFGAHFHVALPKYTGGDSAEIDESPAKTL